MRTLKIEEAKTLVVQKLIRHGYREHDAGVMADCMLWAEMRGNPQGLNKLPDMLKAPALTGRVTSRGECAVRAVEAKSIHAMPAVWEAALVAEDAAKQWGVAAVGVKGTSTSSGALGFYTEHLAERGFIAILISSTIPLVAPMGGTARAVGTNPLAISVPAVQGWRYSWTQATFDAGTSAVSFYEVVSAAAKGEDLPEGVAVDSKGPTRDPKAVLQGGALLPRGSFGAGLGVMIQLIAGSIVGGGDWGHLLIALDPKEIGAGEFSDSALPFLERLHGAGGRLPGDVPVRPEDIAVTEELYALLAD